MEKEPIMIEFKNDEKIDPEGYLWRYIDFHRFFAFIRNQKLFLTRLDKFGDQREGISPEHLLLEIIKKKLGNDPNVKEIVKQLEGFAKVDILPKETNKKEDELKMIQRFNFASCWFYDKQNIESVAMWNLYSKPNSVAIKIKYKDFKEQILTNGVKICPSVKRLILSPIQYINFQDLQEIKKICQNIHSSVFIKDCSFSHEKEFRVIAEKEEKEVRQKKYNDKLSRQHQDKLYDMVYEYPVIDLILNDFLSYKFEVVFHPKSADWAIDDIKALMDEYLPSFKRMNSTLKLN